MAYLVIVHVPYTADIERSNKEDEKPPGRDTLELVEDSNKERLERDDNADIGEDDSENTLKHTDIPVVGEKEIDSKQVEENQPKQDITEDDNDVNEKETEASDTEGEAEGSDKTETCDRTEGSDKTETCEKTEGSDKTETCDRTEGSDKTETCDRTEGSDKTETCDRTEGSGKTETCDRTEGSDKTETCDRTEDSSDIKDHQEENEDHILPHCEELLTPLFQQIPIHKRVEKELTEMGVDNVDMEVVGQGLYQKFSFVQDDSRKCEQILNRLRGIGVGLTAGSSMSVFPSSLHESAKAEVEGKESTLDEGSLGKSDKNEEVDQQKSRFRKSVKSRLLVAQVVESVTANALFTFDYLLLLILASVIACIGLVENSSVILVASMLISPLMGPILAATFGQVIRKKDLRNLGLKSEIKGLAICLTVGFVFGLVSGGVGLHGAVWGSTDSWPTTEMKSRGMLRSLWVGVLIALPSGAGVAISVLGGNAGSLVGVAISASLLPPACNAGMLWAYSLLAAMRPPDVETPSRGSVTTISQTTTLSSVNVSVLPNTTFSTNTTLSSASVYGTTIIPLQLAGSCLPLVNNKYKEEYSCNVAHEAAILGLIKEVAPKSAGVDTFWREDVQVARGYYITTKGESSLTLGRRFLKEYQKLQAQSRDVQRKTKGEETAESMKEDDLSDDESLDNDMATIELHDLLQNVESSPDCRALVSKLPRFPPKKFAEELDNEYNEAALHISTRLAKKPGVYLSDHSIRDKDFQRVYNTIHNLPSTSRPGIVELRDAFKKRKAPSMFIESSVLNDINDVNVESPRQSKSSLGLSNPTSKLFRRRKQKVKFQVTKVEEEQELV